VSQFIDPLKVGFLFSYISPLAFVLAITLLKEAYDDFYRYKRDKEANDTKYKYNCLYNIKLVINNYLGNMIKKQKLK